MGIPAVLSEEDWGESGGGPGRRDRVLSAFRTKTEPAPGDRLEGLEREHRVDEPGQSRFGAAVCGFGAAGRIPRRGVRLHRRVVDRQSDPEWLRVPSERLVADDGNGHRSLSEPFAVRVADDLTVAMTVDSQVLTAPTWASDFEVAVTNLGPVLSSNVTARVLLSPTYGSAINSVLGVPTVTQER